MLEINTQADHAIPISDFRDHMRVTGPASDDALNRALDGAVLQIENQTGIFLRSTSVKQYFRGIPNGLRLTGSPIVPTSSVAIYNSETVSVVSPAAHELNRAEGFPRIRVKDSSAFSVRGFYYAIYSTGYLGTLPADLLIAVFELAGLHFEFREAAAPVQLYSLPFSVRNLLAPYHTGAL